MTPIYKHEVFIKPHFDMIKGLDVNIVLLGRRPFRDFKEAGMISEGQDHSVEILRRDYPNVIIIEHDFDYYCGDLLNLGLEAVREHGCDWMLKLDVDMFLTRDKWDYLLERIKTDTTTEDWLLDFRKCTDVYFKDFDHGVTCDIFEGHGYNTLAIKATEDFIHDGVNIKATGNKSTIDWDDFTIHHFSGWKEWDNDKEIERVENLPRFPGWSKCPKEIREMFNV